jgi:hypothetical protein
MGGLTVVTLFYLLVNVAYIAVLGGPGMLESEAVAQVSGHRAVHTQSRVRHSSIKSPVEV